MLTERVLDDRQPSLRARLGFVEAIHHHQDVGQIVVGVADIPMAWTQRPLLEVERTLEAGQGLV
jgi:hypothetical protein